MSLRNAWPARAALVQSRLAKPPPGLRLEQFYSHPQTSIQPLRLSRFKSHRPRITTRQSSIPSNDGRFPRPAGRALDYAQISASILSRIANVRRTLAPVRIVIHHVGTWLGPGITCVLVLLILGSWVFYVLHTGRVPITNRKQFLLYNGEYDEEVGHFAVSRELTEVTNLSPNNNFDRALIASRSHVYRD